MSSKTKSQLRTENNSSFPNNNSQLITPEILRTFNEDIIDSMVSNEDSGSFTVDSGSLLTTASFDNGTRDMTFTKGDGSTFDVNIPDASGSVLPGGVVSGSSQIDYPLISNIPSGIVSSSEQLPSGLVSGSSQINYPDISNIPSGIVSGSSQLTSSYDTRYALSGSGVTSIIAGTNITIDQSTGDVTINSSGGGGAADTGSLLTTASADFSTMTFTKGDGSTFEVDVTPRQVIETVKNKEGYTLPKGTPVYASGSTGNAVHVYAASSSRDDRMPAAYVLNEELTADAEGNGLLLGFINGVDTSAFTSGDVIYVGANGGYTNQKPTGYNQIQNLGKVIVSDAGNGSGVVSGAGRSNDLPNIQEGYAWVGDSNGVPQPVSTASWDAHSDLTSLNQFTQSQEIYNTGINSYTASNDIRVGDIETYVTQSSQRLDLLEDFTASQESINSNLNSYTSSTDGRLNNIESTTSSLQGEVDSLTAETSSYFKLNANNTANGDNIFSGSITTAAGTTLLFGEQSAVPNFSNTAVWQYPKYSNLDGRGIDTNQAELALYGNNTNEVFAGAVGFQFATSGSNLAGESRGLFGPLANQMVVANGATGQQAVIQMSLNNLNSASLGIGANNVSFMTGPPVESAEIGNPASTVPIYMQQQFVFANPGDGYATPLTINIDGSLTASADISSSASIHGNQFIGGTVTASLQEGYVWVGDSTNTTTTVATSSFGGGGSGFPFTGDAVISGSLQVTGSMRGDVVTLTDVAGTTTVDFEDGNMFVLTLPSSSNTVITPSNIKAGQTVNIQITQPATTGSCTFASSVKFAGGYPFTATTTGSAVDMLTMVSYDGTNVLATGIKNFS